VLHVADVPLYAENLHTFGWTMYREFTPVGIIAGVIGFVVLLRRRATVAIALLLAIALPSAFALSYPPVVEIERYFFIPMIAFALIAGLGITALAPAYRNLLRIPVAAAALVLLVTSYGDAHLRSVNGAEEFIARVRILTPSNAIVIADWTRGTSLAYAAYVERSMGDRIIDISWLNQDRPYVRRWMNERPVYYVGRAVLHRGILLCPLSSDYPIYAVRLVPGQCR
jgi:4-amino-4-deoxy-L-arabinose transferase-like glycosyltransferase